MNVKILTSNSISRWSLFGLILIFSCKEHDNPILYNDLEGDVILSFREVHTNDIGIPPEFRLVMLTEDTLRCGNYTIAYEMEKIDSTLIVNVLGQPPIFICATALRQAEGSLQIKEDFNKLILSYKDQEDIYEVSMSPTSTSVQPLKQSFTSFESTDYWRYVKNSFALVCNKNSDAGCIKFKETLISQIDGLEEFSYPDQGLSPFYYQLENSEEVSLSYFQYSQLSELFDAGILLESFRRNDSSKLYIISWDNYRF